MSMKVYYAWKVPADEINTALNSLNDQAIKQEHEFLQEIYDNVPDEKVQEKIDEGSKHSEEVIRLSLAIAVAMTHNKLTYPYGDIPPNAACNMWFFEGYWYIIPYGNYKWEVPVGFQDFAYWNNVDKPEDISDEKWSHRAEVWDSILENEYELKCGHVMLKYEWPHEGMLELCKTIIEDEEQASNAHIIGTIYARDMIRKIEEEMQKAKEQTECPPNEPESSEEPSTPSMSDTSN
jgi:hypothetical protein